MSTVGAPPIPAGTDLHADQGTRIISATIALIILPTIFVILRFLSRYIARAGLWWDDALVTAALILSWGPCICVIVGEHINGFGKHLWALPDPSQDTRTFLKILYIYALFYYLSVVTIKLAILAFYRRIFPATQLRLTLWLGWALVLAYGVATIFATIFQCQPIHGFWDKQIPFHCDDFDQGYVAAGALNVALDFLIIGLPIPLLWKLRTTTSQKSVLTGIFTCAGFVCIISIVRIVVISHLKIFDVTWNYVESGIWSAAEPCMGVVAACIPSLRPLLSLIIRGTYRGPTMYSKSAQNTTSTSSSRMVWSRRAKQGDDLNQVGPGSFTKLEDAHPGSSKWGHDVQVKGGKERRERKKPTHDTALPDDGISLEEMVPQSGIKVKSEIVITTSAWEYKDRVF